MFRFKFAGTLIYILFAQIVGNENCIRHLKYRPPIGNATWYKSKKSDLQLESTNLMNYSLLELN